MDNRGINALTRECVFLQSSLITVSRIFSFSATFRSLDLLVTDILAGLLLLRKDQHSRQACILSEVNHILTSGFCSDDVALAAD